MAQPESEHPESEESDPSKLNVDPTSSEGSGVGNDDSFQNDVEDMISSVELDVSDSKEIEAPKDSEKDLPVQKDDSNLSPNLSADDLLMRAGSILNGGETEIPDIEVEADPEADASGTEPEGLMSMPDPQSLMSESEEISSEETEASDSEDDDLIAMPDPQSLMEEAGAVAESPDPKRPANIAERAGDLPPPPPAPVALEEDEIERELSSGDAEAVEEPEASNDQEASETEDSIPDEPEDLPSVEPVSDNANEEVVEQGIEELGESVNEQNEDGDDLLLDDEDSFLTDDDDESDLLVSIQNDIDADLNSDSASRSGNSSASSGSGSTSDGDQGSSKFRYLSAATRSLPFAAGLAILGIGLIFSSIKNELFEWVSHGDTQGSSFSRSIATATTQLFDDLGPDSPYQMVWMESEIKRVSDTELLIEAQVGAELEVDLYQAVDESVVYSKLPFEADQLNEAAQNLERIGNESIGLPAKGWDRLYKHSASKGEVFPFSISFRFLKLDSDWELSGTRMKEGDHGFAWSRGRPKDFFGMDAVDVHSNEFTVAFRAFEKAGITYLKNAAIAEKEYLASLDESARQAQERRQDLMMSLSQGSYFKGMVIAGDEGSDAREVSLIITETRSDGGMIKGVMKLDEKDSSAKHFTGFFDVVEDDHGFQGQLNLTTIAFAGQNALAGTPAFFNPGTVSKIKLQTDGYRMEGDADEISLRLIRSL